MKINSSRKLVLTVLSLCLLLSDPTKAKAQAEGIIAPLVEHFLQGLAAGIGSAVVTQALAPDTWVAGRPHPTAPHVLASVERNVWEPAPGWFWENDRPGDFRVLPFVSDRSDSAAFLASGSKAPKSYVGIGALLRLDTNSFFIPEITKVFPGSPAEQAGLKPGMLLASVNSISLKHHSVNTAATIIRDGEIGSEILLQAFRADDPQLKSFVVKRASVTPGND